MAGHSARIENGGFELPQVFLGSTVMQQLPETRDTDIDSPGDLGAPSTQLVVPIVSRA